MTRVVRIGGSDPWLRLMLILKRPCRRLGAGSAGHGWEPNAVGLLAAPERNRDERPYDGTRARIYKHPGQDEAPAGRPGGRRSRRERAAALRRRAAAAGDAAGPRL